MRVLSAMNGESVELGVDKARVDVVEHLGPRERKIPMQVWGELSGLPTLHSTLALIIMSECAHFPGTIPVPLTVCV